MSTMPLPPERRRNPIADIVVPSGSTFSRDPFVLSGSVGRFGDNRRDDLIKAQILLANAGYYDLPRPGAPTGWPSGALNQAIRRYQKDQGLEPDGTILPLSEAGGGIGRNGEGETLAALQGELGDRLTGRAAPTPEQVDAFYEQRARQLARDGEDAPSPPTPIALRGEDGSAKAPLGTVPANGPAPVMSDIDPPPQQLKPGQQEALLPAALIPVAEAALTYGVPLLLGGAYAASQMQQGQQNASTSQGPSLLERAKTLHEDGKTLDPRTSQDDLAAFTPLPGIEPAPPSRPVGEADKQAAQTPPLIPPQVNDKLQGRPAEPVEPTVEQLIPPKLAGWITKLPPLEQPLAKDFAGIILERNDFGSRGKPETEKATRIAVKTCLAELQNYPEMRDKLKHFAGSYRNGNEGVKNYRPEEVIRNKDGSNGFSRPDASFGDKQNPESPYSARLNTVDVKKTGVEHDEASLTANERRRYNKLKTNIYNGVTGWARKMRPGESDAAYGRYVAKRCRAMWDDLDAKLRQDGILPPK